MPFDIIKTNDLYYQIFVISFADGNNDGIGDLKGITDKLDYLSDLGITGIWLTPINKAETFHKYDVVNYTQIDEQFGTTEDLVNLVSEAHKRGIKIILDLVFNCVSYHNDWFLSALNDKNSKYRKYFYFWDDVKSTGKYDLGAIWNTLPSWRTATNDKGEEVKYIGIYDGIMPDLNFNTPEVRKECKKVAEYFLSLGVDGFRLDSAMHLYSSSETGLGEDFHGMNVEWWGEFFSYLREIKPDVYLVSEVWENEEIRARYMTTLGSDFSFFLGENLSVAINEGRDKDFAFADFIEKNYETFRRYCGMNYINAPFLSNHDEPRYAGVRIKETETDKLKASASSYLLMEGNPFVYYGEEVALAGERKMHKLNLRFDWAYPPDEDMYIKARTAMPWGDKYTTNYIEYDDDSSRADVLEQLGDNRSLLSHYRDIIALRKRIYDGSEMIRVLKLDERLLSYEMKGDKNAYLVIVSLSSEATPLPTAAKSGELIFGATGKGNMVTPYSTLVYKIRPQNGK